MKGPVFLAAACLWSAAVGGAAAAGPEFPPELRRSQPVARIEQAVVYTVNEVISSDADLDLALQTGADVLIRGWFKWRQAVDYSRLARHPARARAAGALFGGGLTCSALYDGENGLTEAQLLDMATRGPDGRLVNAWNQPGCRHGSLSSPAYREYVLSWSRRQIDAGADYLFMDEINAALSEREGFDDHAIRDFQQYLGRRFGDGDGWTPTDSRWRQQFQVDAADRAICPDGTIGSFQYREYLRRGGYLERPHAANNPLARVWRDFRRERDDRAWEWLTGAIRDYARSQGRAVFLSANGLAKHVDLQVLGVWDLWRAQNGRVDLAENQIFDWHSVVVSGVERAGRPVPVVFFHDWGFNGFPWVEVPVEDRRLWLRTRAAEIYAAGGFFAFPVRGPWGPNAQADGLMGDIIRQTAFYRKHEDLFLKGRVLGFEPLETSAGDLSLALWQADAPNKLALHLVNRQVSQQRLVLRSNVSVRLPVAAQPKAASAISPDWPAARAARANLSGGWLQVTVPDWEAYAVVLLEFDHPPVVRLSGQRIAPAALWERPSTNQFRVLPGGNVENRGGLNGFLQGRLHPDLSNPPTFLVNAPTGGWLRVQVRSVATLGAVLEYLVDERLVKTLPLPDRDRRNDPRAREYVEVFDFAIPPGRHRLALRNSGGDWLVVGWFAFSGEFRPY